MPKNNVSSWAWFYLDFLDFKSLEKIPQDIEGAYYLMHSMSNTHDYEKLEKEDKTNYIHSDNHQNMFENDKENRVRNWILEIHFVDEEKQIGGFFEQLLA